MNDLIFTVPFMLHEQNIEYLCLWELSWW